jgi:hypothetical protein
MKTIVVVSRKNSATIHRTRYREFVENAIVFKHLAKFVLYTLLNCDRVYWLFGVADVPNFDGQEVPADYILSALYEISGRVTRYHLSEKVLLA